MLDEFKQSICLLFVVGKEQGNRMHGLIFMTWEKYLGQRFGPTFLSTYRETIGEATADLPLATRLYEDAVLLAGVGAASDLSHLPVETLLHEYGSYFILNSLTRHLCAYIFTSVHSARDLVLAMRDSHARMRRTLDGLVPPLFEYQHSDNPDEVILLYDSSRQLCPLLFGAIEGAAERYAETVQIQELSCMKQGASVCRIRARFTPPPSDPTRYTDFHPAKPQEVQTILRTTFLKQIWAILPEAGTINGFTLDDLQERLERYHRLDQSLLRPAVLLEVLHQLQFAGYAMSTAAQNKDNLISRRYWRVHRHM